MMRQAIQLPGADLVHKRQGLLVSASVFWSHVQELPLLLWKRKSPSEGNVQKNSTGTKWATPVHCLLKLAGYGLQWVGAHRLVL